MIELHGRTLIRLAAIICLSQLVEPEIYLPGENPALDFILAGLKYWLYGIR